MKNLVLLNNIHLQQIAKIALYLGISLYPLYIFDSGSIQPSHFFFLIFSALTLLSFKIYVDKYFVTFLIFLIYSYFVNIFYLYSELINFSTIENLKYIKEVLFLSYNFILTISLLSFLKQQKEFKKISFCIVAAITIIFFSLCYDLYFSQMKFRFTSYFNNPNQLGYFCVCIFSLIYLFYRNNYFPYYLLVIFLFIIILFSILTLSKASYIALLFCVFFSLKPLKSKYSKLIEPIFFLFIFLIFLIFFLQISELSIFKRTVNMFSESDSSLEIRGYKVFFEANPLQAIFGMGIKNIIDIHKFEIHSTFFMVLTNYGLIGFLIFSMLILFWILDIKKAYGVRGLICVCAPCLLYGLTHNGIRFSMFWIMFSISIYLSYEFRKKIRRV